MSHINKRKTFKKILLDGNSYIVPGVYDGISAKIVEKVGFQLMSITGNGIAASTLGMPDIGLISMKEVADRAASIASCTYLPIIADADTGYGNGLNIIRTVTEFESAGVAGIHIEDQVSPKRCAYYGGRRNLVSVDEQVEKIKAAVYAKNDKDFCIIARTDALRSSGLKEAIERSKKYLEAGADAFFIVGLSDKAQILEIQREIKAPIVVNINDGDSLGRYSLEDFNELGVKFIFYPATIRSAAARAIKRAMESLHECGHTQNILQNLASLDEFNEIMDVSKYIKIGEMFVRE